MLLKKCYTYFSVLLWFWCLKFKLKNPDFLFIYLFIYLFIFNQEQVSIFLIFYMWGSIYSKKK